MVLLVSLLAVITALMLMDFLKGPPGSNNPKLHLHWLFVIGSVFGQGEKKNSNSNFIRISCKFECIFCYYYILK